MVPMKIQFSLYENEFGAVNSFRRSDPGRKKWKTPPSWYDNQDGRKIIT